MSVLGGLFLMAHGLVHLAVWLPSPKDDAPFDPRHSWLLRDAGQAARSLAIVAGALLVASGVLVVAAVDLGALLAAAGAAVSLLLVLLTFNRWLLGAVAINVAIIAVAVA